MNPRSDLQGSRAGETTTERPSMLVSRKSATSHLAEFQNSIGRSEREREFLSVAVAEFADIYRRHTMLLVDKRFVRFQQGLAQARAALSEFSAAELSERRGQITSRVANYALPEFARRHRKNRDEEDEPSEYMLSEYITLDIARLRLSHLARFFVDHTPLTDEIGSDDHIWESHYSPWQRAESRSNILDHEPRSALARHLANGPEIWKPDEKAADLFDQTASDLARASDRLAKLGMVREAEEIRQGAVETRRTAAWTREGRSLSTKVRPTELMLLALLHGLPGESFDGTRAHYDRTLDAWMKAMSRAKPRRTKPSRPELVGRADRESTKKVSRSGGRKQPK